MGCSRMVIAPASTLWAPVIGLSIYLLSFLLVILGRILLQLCFFSLGRGYELGVECFFVLPFFLGYGHSFAQWSVSPQLKHGLAADAFYFFHWSWHLGFLAPIEGWLRGTSCTSPPCQVSLWQNKHSFAEGQFYLESSLRETNLFWRYRWKYESLV